jgi:hypothetical protein
LECFIFQSYLDGVINHGPAQSVLTDLRPEMRVNYLHLTSALSSRFQPENQAEMYRAQMKNKLRGKNEPIPKLGVSWNY